jgi:hypothetical protein
LSTAVSTAQPSMSRATQHRLPQPPLSLPASSPCRYHIIAATIIVFDVSNTERTSFCCTISAIAAPPAPSPAVPFAPIAPSAALAATSSMTPSAALSQVLHAHQPHLQLPLPPDRRLCRWLHHQLGHRSCRRLHLPQLYLRLRLLPHRQLCHQLHHQPRLQRHRLLHQLQHRYQQHHRCAIRGTACCTSHTPSAAPLSVFGLAIG